MAEYIEQEETVRKVLSALVDVLDLHNTVQAIKIANKIREIPTADVVEVVRCKECNHRYEPVNCALWYGTLGDKEYFIDRGENFYCSYGEKKEGDAND